MDPKQTKITLTETENGFTVEVAGKSLKDMLSGCCVPAFAAGLKMSACCPPGGDRASECCPPEQTGK